MTNANKIRAMTDEELAHILENCDCCIYEFSDGDGYCTKNVKCYESWLEWLQKEGEET